MKQFIFDTLVDEENICNLARERKTIASALEHHKKLIVYAPRNYGKTSLVKNAVLPAFKKKHKKSFVLFADLMGVKSWEGIEHRMGLSFAHAFAQSFPAQQLIETAKRFIAGLRPQISFDAATGTPSLSLSADSAHTPTPLADICRSIASIGREFPCVMVLDEFQDIVFVDEAEAKFRAALQELGNIAIVIMGSKRHILANIFAKPAAPFAAFGQDLEFRPIPYEEYHAYIEERFLPKKLAITLDTATFLEQRLNRIPEAINIVCAHLQDTHERCKITREMVTVAVGEVVQARQSRFEQYLSNVSAKEEEVLVQLARHEPVKYYNSVTFLKTVSSTARTVGIVINNLWNKSVIEKNEDGFHIADPLLREYVLMFR